MWRSGAARRRLPTTTSREPTGFLRPRSSRGPTPLRGVLSGVHGNRGSSSRPEFTGARGGVWLPRKPATLILIVYNGLRSYPRTITAEEPPCRWVSKTAGSLTKKFLPERGRPCLAPSDDQPQFRTSARFTNRTGFSRRGTVTIATGAVNACDVRHPIPGDTSVTMA